MRRYKKEDFPVHNVRRFLEPGPIVLVSSAYKDQTNIMTMGWHMVMEFSPALVGCLIAGGNHSHDLIRQQPAMRDQYPDRRHRGNRGEDRQHVGTDHRQVCRVRPHPKAGHPCPCAVDRGMLCQFRVHIVRRELGQQIQRVRVRSRKGACGDLAERCPRPSTIAATASSCSRAKRHESTESYSGRECCEYCFVPTPLGRPCESRDP